MPNLLIPDDAINVVAVIADLLAPDHGEEVLSETANGIALVLALNADAVRHAGGAAPTQTPTPHELMAQARTHAPNVGRATAFVARARQHLYGDEHVDFATPIALDYLLGAASLLLSVLGVEGEDEDDASALPSAGPIPRVPAGAKPAGATVH